MPATAWSGMVCDHERLSGGEDSTLKKARFVTAEQMRWIEAQTVERYGISVLLLMECAGVACVEEILNLRLPQSSRVTIFCGPGNNGGDGFVIARHLKNLGFKVQVLRFSSQKPLSPEAQVNLKLLKKMKVSLVTNPSALATEKYLRVSKLVVDALFGIGLSRPLEGAIARVITQINASKAKVLAVDIPSGLSADTGKVLGAAVQANLTVTFGLPKKSFSFSHTKKVAGKVIVKKICFPAALLRR